MSRILHKLRTATTIALSLCVTLAFLVRHPARFLANRSKRGLPLASIGNDRPIRSILVVKIDGLGDFVLATPLLRLLRARYAAARIVYVVDRWLEGSVGTLGLADEVIGFDWRGGILSAAGRAARLAAQELSAPFDLAVVPRWEVDLNYASILAFLSNSVYRVGFSRKVSRRKRFLNFFNDALYSHVVVAAPELHELEKNLCLSRALGIDSSSHELYFRGSPLPAGLEALLPAGGAEAALRPVVALGIGAMGPNRRWPIENFVQVARWTLATYPGSLVLLIGGAADRVNASIIREGAEDGQRVLDLTGALSVNQSFEALCRCTVFLGNDSGPKHLAAAARTHIVEISSFPIGGDPAHYSAANRFGAWGDGVQILQPERAVPPCKSACVMYEPHCIATISAERAIAALKGLLVEVAS